MSRFEPGAVLSLEVKLDEEDPTEEGWHALMDVDTYGDLRIVLPIADPDSARKIGEHLLNGATLRQLKETF